MSMSTATDSPSKPVRSARHNFEIVLASSLVLVGYALVMAAC